MAEIKDCCSCIYANRSTFTEPCVSCGVDFRNYVAKPEPKRKRKTNADRIRSMSDEELAEWLDKLITHCNDGPCFNCFMQKACLTSMLDWLKEAET